MEKGVSKEEAEETFFADFNIYSSMAHFVGKELHIRPNEILDTWGVPELIVAYGYYANEKSNANYQEWASYDAQTRAKLATKNGTPEQFAVRFYGIGKLND